MIIVLFSSLLNAQTAAKTQSYWEKGSLINEYLSDEYDEIKDPSSSPSKVTEIYKRAAQKIKKLDKTSVDPLVIDFGNKMVLYYETTSQLVKNGSKKSWWKQFYEWLAGITNLLSGLNKFMVIAPEVGKLETDEQKRIYELHQDAAKCQLEVISKMRKKYQIELATW